MKRNTLKAAKIGTSIIPIVDLKIDVLSMAKKKCGELFKQRFEARMYEDIIPKDVRLQIKSLTRDDVISTLDANGIVDIETLVTLSIQRSIRSTRKSIRQS